MKRGFVISISAFAKFKFDKHINLLIQKNSSFILMKGKLFFALRLQAFYLKSVRAQTVWYMQKIIESRDHPWDLLSTIELYTIFNG